MKVRLIQNAFGHWIIVDADNERLAWTGMRWVPIDARGFTTNGIAVCNFPLRVTATAYAKDYGMIVLSKEEQHDRPSGTK